MFIFERVKNYVNDKNIFFLIDMVLIVIGSLMLIYRIFLGIDFTDQSWYVAEPYIVSEGAVPYANNWSQVPGFTIPLAVFTKLYTFFVGGTEGIFLFSRIEYIIWLVVAGGFVYFFLKQGDIKDKSPIIIMLPFLFITPHQLFSINYNTIGLVYLLLVCVILFNDFNVSNVTMQFIKGIASGLLMARAVIGTPYIILPCVIILVILFGAKEWKKMQGFVCGGIIAAVLVVGWCCLRSGVHKFIEGLKYWLNDCAYFKLKGSSSLYTNYIEFFSYLKIFMLCMAFACIASHIIKENKTFEIILHVMLCAVLVIGCLQYLYTNNFKIMTYWSWFEPIILYIFLPKSDERERMKLFSLINVLYSSVFIFSSFNNVSGFGKREYWLYIPLIFSFIAIFSWNMKSVQRKIALRIGLIFLTFLMVRLSYSYVYRDEPIENLTTRVESGVWKGLYTTKEYARAVVGLENYIKTITEKDDNVLFMDWSSFGYLMSNGKACSPSSYDNMTYSYGTNDPQVMYDYFVEIEEVPDKIIYIDFGRDEMLSIENAKWKFNQFVLENYLLNEIWRNSTFRVKSYVLIDEDNAKKVCMESNR